MKLTAQEFLSQPRKAITLIGMSGAGKTHLSCLLAREGWEHYSCDVLIGSALLGPAAVSAEDLGALSAFIGKVGDKGKDGLCLEEFKQRQKMYHDAECNALNGVVSAIEESSGCFVNDSTGSLCEIEDAALIDRLGQKTLFVYLRVGAAEEADILRRAQDYPKPMYFPPVRFDFWLDEFMRERGLMNAGQVDPDEFSVWVFPRLFAARLPKYQDLADTYGVTIPAARLRDIRNARDFTDIVAAALP